MLLRPRPRWTSTTCGCCCAGEDEDGAVHDAAVVLGAGVHRASLSQGREAFLEGHVYAFERLGWVPIEKIRYDNLKPASRGRLPRPKLLSEFDFDANRAIKPAVIGQLRLVKAGHPLCFIGGSGRA
jgi:transposase